MGTLRSVVAAGVVAFLMALSGCSAHSTRAAIVSVDVGQGDASLRVAVEDEATLPLAGAVIGIKGVEQTASTAENGVATLSGLAPGPVTVYVSKLGYGSDARAVDLVSGQSVEVAVTLKPVALEGRPAGRVQVLNGYLACGVGAVVVTSVQCGSGDPNQKFLHSYEITPNMTGVLWEVVWTSTQVLSKDLVFSIERSGCGLTCADTFASVHGCCYLRVALPGEKLDLPNVKAHTKGATIQSRTFPDFQTQEHLPTLFTSQPFKIYVEYREGPLPADFLTTRTNRPA